MLFVILSWLAFFLMLTGSGALAVAGLARATRALNLAGLDLFQTFWIGCAVVITCAQLTSLIAPLGPASLVVWALASIAGWLILWPAVRRPAAPASGPGIRTRSDWVRLGGVLASAAAVVLIGASHAATREWSGAYDTDLYHFNQIRWTNEYAAVPGLGNLHARLGLTSGFLILSALVDNLWWDLRSAWLTSGFFVTMTCLQWVWTIAFPGPDAPRRRRLFCILTLPYLLRLLTTIEPTLYFDETALLVQLVLMAELLRWAPSFGGAQGGAADSRARRDAGPFTIATLAALGFSIKPIGAVSLLVAWPLAAVMLLRAYRSRHAGRATPTKLALAAFGVGGLVVLSHVARNAVLTGWLLYPAPAGGLAVDWAMPERLVDEQYQVIKAWARLPGPQYHLALTEGFPFWFPRWRQRQWNGIEPWWLYLGSILVAAELAVGAAGRIGKREFPGDLLLIGLAGANLCFWFLTAPDMRFGRAFFWIWMGVGGCIFLSSTWVKPALALGVAGLTTVGALGWMSPRWVPPHAPTLWAVGRAAARPVRARVLANGQMPPLVVNVPMVGDQCGDCALPATPYPVDTLQWRRPGDLGAGFRMLP